MDHSDFAFIHIVAHVAIAILIHLSRAPRQPRG